MVATKRVTFSLGSSLDTLKVKLTQPESGGFQAFPVLESMTVARRRSFDSSTTCAAHRIVCHAGDRFLSYSVQYKPNIKKVGRRRYFATLRFQNCQKFRTFRSKLKYRRGNGNMFQVEARSIFYVSTILWHSNSAVTKNFNSNLSTTGNRDRCVIQNLKLCRHSTPFSAKLRCNS